MYANNCGGLLLPQLLSQQSYILLDAFKVFLPNRWHFDYLFLPKDNDNDLVAIQPHPFLYLLASSLWQTNLHYLDERIKQLSFVDIRNPDRETNGKLHDMRENLARLKAGLAETVTWAPKHISDYVEQSKNRDDGLYLATPSPLIKIHDMQSEAKELEAFLMETFQLLMSFLSVQDSQISIQQSRRGTLITVLAFVYVPLSFVTGIFGMNVKQINGSPLDLWVCFAALAVVVVGTVVGYAAYKGWQWWKTRDRKQQSRHRQVTRARTEKHRSWRPKEGSTIV